LPGLQIKAINNFHSQIAFPVNNLENLVILDDYASTLCNMKNYLIQQIKHLKININ